MNKFLFILLFYSSSAGCQPLVSDTLSAIASDNTDNFNGDSLLVHAIKHLGKPYKNRGISPSEGFDCSGFVCYNFKKYNIALPRSPWLLIKQGIEVQKENAKPGDLIFFKGSNVKSLEAGHVGIIVSKSENSIKFIHAAIKGGIRYDSTSSTYYRQRFLGIRRIINASSKTKDSL